jgi:hypothetical protein
MVEPTQKGPALVAVVVGVNTVTLTVPVFEQERAVTVTVYTPALIEVALPMVGFCNADVNAFGPLHE